MRLRPAIRRPRKTLQTHIPKIPVQFFVLGFPCNLKANLQEVEEVAEGQENQLQLAELEALQALEEP